MWIEAEELALAVFASLCLMVQLGLSACGLMATLRWAALEMGRQCRSFIKQAKTLPRSKLAPDSSCGSIQQVVTKLIAEARKERLVKFARLCGIWTAIGVGMMVFGILNQHGLWITLPQGISLVGMHGTFLVMGYCKPAMRKHGCLVAYGAVMLWTCAFQLTARDDSALAVVMTSSISLCVKMLGSLAVLSTWCVAVSNGAFLVAVSTTMRGLGELQDNGDEDAQVSTALFLAWELMSCVTIILAAGHCQSMQECDFLARTKAGGDCVKVPLVYALLSTTCDVVVELDDKLAFTNHGRELTDFLMHSRNSENLQGNEFKRYILNPQSQLLFEERLLSSKNQLGAPQAFTAALRDSSGGPVDVELVHVPYETMCRRTHYLVGIRGAVDTSESLGMRKTVQSRSNRMHEQTPGLRPNDNFPAPQASLKGRDTDSCADVRDEFPNAAQRALSPAESRHEQQPIGLLRGSHEILTVVFDASTFIVLDCSDNFKFESSGRMTRKALLLDWLSSGAVNMEYFDEHDRRLRELSKAAISGEESPSCIFQTTWDMQPPRSRNLFRATVTVEIKVPRDQEGSDARHSDRFLVHATLHSVTWHARKTRSRRPNTTVSGRGTERSAREESSGSFAPVPHSL